MEWERKWSKTSSASAHFNLVLDEDLPVMERFEIRPALSFQPWASSESKQKADMKMNSSWKPPAFISASLLHIRWIIVYLPTLSWKIHTSFLQFPRVNTTLFFLFSFSNSNQWEFQQYVFLYIYITNRNQCIHKHHGQHHSIILIVYT